MHVKIRFVDNSPTCASLSQTQMHWEISCEGICIAVDEAAKLKLGLSILLLHKVVRPKRGGLKEVFP